MSSGTPPRTAWALARLVLLAGALSACPDTEHPSHEDPGSVPASEAVRQLAGVERYGFHVPPEGGASVVLLAADGTARASLQLTGSPLAGAVSVLVADDGSSAVARAMKFAGSADTSWVRVRLEAEGQVLELLTLANADLSVRRAELAVPGQGSGSSGPVSGEGLARTFAAFDSGQPAPPAALQAWLASAGVDRLLASRAAFLLLLSQADSQLFAGLAQAESPETHEHLAVLRQGLHKGAPCDNLISQLSTSFGLCLTCIGELAAAPGTGGVTGVLAIATCAACTGLTSYTLYLYSQCKQFKAEADTIESCRQWCLQNLSAAHDAELGPTEHGDCKCTCNKDKCEALLRSKLLPGQSLCLASCGNERCGGQVQTCGDGVIDSIPGCAAEECDPGSGTGSCPSGKHCEDCRCVEDGLACGGIRCAPGQECHGCGFTLICAQRGSTCCQDGYGAFFACAPGTVCRDCGCVPSDQPGPGPGCTSH